MCDQSQALQGGPSTQSRHTMHHQMVGSTLHDNLASRTCPSVPAGRARAHRSDRTLRVLDRHLGRREQRSARHRTRTRAYASATPKITAELRAQAAHGPTSDLARADVVRAMLTRATCVATRSPLCALRSTGVRGAASPARASSIGLPQSYPSGAPEGDSNSTPVSTTGWSRHWRRNAVTTRDEAASRSAAALPHLSHAIERRSKSTTHQRPRSSPCALHSSRNAPATMGGSRRGNRA